MQHQPRFSKLLTCYQLQGSPVYTDKLVAPQSLLSEIIEYFKNISDAQDHITQPSNYHQARTSLSPIAAINSRRIQNAGIKKQLVASKRKINRIGTLDISTNEPHVFTGNTGTSLKSTSPDLSNYNRDSTKGYSGSYSDDTSSEDENVSEGIHKPKVHPRLGNKDDRNLDLIPSPLTFEMSKSIDGSKTKLSTGSQKKLCVGIKEFSSTEGSLGIPLCIMAELGLVEGDTVLLDYVKLKKGLFAQFVLLEPATINNKTDLRSIMESFMRKNLTALTENQVVTINSESLKYVLQATRLEPENKIDIIDTDLSVDIEFLDQRLAKDATIHSPKSLYEYKFMELDSLSEGYLTSTDTPWFVIDFNKIKNPHNGNQFTTIKLKFNLFDTTSDIDIFGRKGLLKPTKLDFEKCDISGNTESKFILIENLETNPEYGNYYSVALFLYGDVGTRFKYSVTLDNNDNRPQSVNEPKDTVDLENGVTCKNCKVVISKEKYFLHEAVCYRNVKLCEICQQPVNKQDFGQKKHIHCSKCDHVGDEYQVLKHNHYLHGNYRCPECSISDHDFDSSLSPGSIFNGDSGIFSSVIDLAQHRNSICPGRVIICRFCHTLVRQGKAPTLAMDVLEGYHEHESYCGSRTIVCEVCKKNVQLRSIKIHAQSHELAKQLQSMPYKLCCNTECRQLFENLPSTSHTRKIQPQSQLQETKLRFPIDNKTCNPLGLCQKCFLPYVITDHDPVHKVLMQRLINGLYRQLIYGCDNSFCQNSSCATGNPILKTELSSPNEAAKRLIPVAKSITARITNPSKSSLELSLCVDYQSFKHKQAVDEVEDYFASKTNHTQSQDKKGHGWKPLKRYETEWVSLAALKTGNSLNAAIKWLTKNAPVIRN